jgi:lipopolysaccharide/colanic/teichoic acid biosynthesis glycosyltransferase
MTSFHDITKRLFDLLFSIIGIIIVSPVLIIISLAIKLDTKGPVFFKQGRLGKNGKVFMIWKFRSMVVNAENIGTGLFNFANDPRVTKTGNFLRKLSLDELPQFFNILKGDMSFVGPRPPVTYELGIYEEMEPELKARFEVKPGVTGYAQINGRNELSRDEKTGYDLKYIHDFYKWGVLLDIGIILVTIYKIIKMEGSYELPENMETDSTRIMKNN